jgi:hypothetical protein
MRALTWTTCLWPGLPALWVRGQFGGLVAAVAFGSLLNGALLATLAPAVLPDAFTGTASRVVAWLLVLGFWMVGVWRARTQSSAGPTKVDPTCDRWFGEAQTEYLKGHWVEAEMLLTNLLARHPADVEARLLLASVQRRTKRMDEANQTLRELAALPAAGRWAREIQSELQKIADMKPGESERDDERGLARAA